MSSRGFEQFLYSIPNERERVFDVDNVISPSADWNKLEGTAVIIRRIISQLLIVKGTYMFDPLFGENILQFLFEPADGETQRRLNDVVTEVIEQNKENEDVTHEVLWFRTKKGFRINIIVKTHGKLKKVPIDIDETLLKDSS